jgi:hypothetical protein
MARSQIDPRNPGLKPELLAADAPTNIVSNTATHGRTIHRGSCDDSAALGVRPVYLRSLREFMRCKTDQRDGVLRCTPAQRNG